jgi:polyferredoxin
VEVMHDFQKLLVVILVEGCFFESLPFEYLAGGAVYKWKRWVWAIIFAVTTFLVLQLLWDPSGTLSSIESSPPGMTYVMIVLVYAVSVIALFVYCKVRRKTR